MKMKCRAHFTPKYIFEITLIVINLNTNMLECVKYFHCFSDQCKLNVCSQENYLQYKIQGYKCMIVTVNLLIENVSK